MSTTSNIFTCNTYHAIEKKKKEKEKENFWLTLTGLLLRIDSLSQDFLFGVSNDVIRYTAVENKAITQPVTAPIPPIVQPSPFTPQPQIIQTPPPIPELTPETTPDPLTPTPQTTQKPPLRMQYKLTSYLKYRTAEDDKVCSICQGFGNGGVGKGYYLVTQPLPKIPDDTHFWCRCQWELVFGYLDYPEPPF